MGQYGFYFDSAKCTGCKTCQVACKENHHLPAHNLFRRVYHYAGGSWEPTEAGFYAPVDTFSYQVSVSCNHCADPACVAACPTGAMHKDPETGRVPLGDMAISLERAKQQAQEFGHSTRREVGYLTIHSILHLLGYDHVDEGPMKRQMRAREEAILAEIELPRK